MTDEQRRKKHLERLERLIDLYGLASVLGMLSDIASLKADHIRENWQDEPLASAWAHASNEIEYICTRQAISALIAAEGRRKERA